jgi:hypothetical protein
MATCQGISYVHIEHSTSGASAAQKQEDRVQALRGFGMYDLVMLLKCEHTYAY